mmetsp:Transcript_37342/g.91483  ORF Transcript_37342/g.91483 Transcript_37342/m.91483 type:complete len:426 (+) Transcript_37342:113-1390(+)
MSAQGLPAHILALFTPRPPPEHFDPMKEKVCTPLTGIGEYVELFETTAPPPRETFETPKQRKARRLQEAIDEHKEYIKSIIAEYRPKEDGNASGDPYKTLFVARMSYDTTEKKLKREFENWGPVKRVKIIHDLNGKSRGYGFIEFADERDLKNAYKQADGRKIDGKRVLVDVERGRTVDDWKPRRLGGGRGPGRVAKLKKADQEAKDAAERAKRAAEAEAAAERDTGGRDHRPADRHRDDRHRDERSYRRDDRGGPGGDHRRDDRDRRPQERGPLDRPHRPGGDRPGGDRDRPGGDRGGDRDRAAGDRPGGDRDRAGGDRDRDRDRDRRGGDRDRDRDRDRGRDRDRERGEKKEEVKDEIKADPAANGGKVDVKEERKDDRDRDRDRDRGRDRDRDRERDRERKEKRSRSRNKDKKESVVDDKDI